MAKPTRPDVPAAWVERVHGILSELPQCEEEEPWTGARWSVAGNTVAHIFGGHDQLFRITFRATPDEVAAFGHMGDPYFSIAENAVGMLVNEDTDWEELAECLIGSFLVQAPRPLAAEVEARLFRDG